MRRLREQTGQAAIELVAAVPFVVLAGLVAWQLALAGHAAWLTANAARVAARAEAVGRDPAVAARSALPRALERGLRVRRRRSGGVEVTARVPLVLARRGPAVSVSASASLGGQR
jgi:hypothetical protein